MFTPIANVKWKVMNYAEVRPTSPTPAVGVNLANYQFLVRAPKGTGFQVDRKECVWPPNPWPNTDSRWVSASNATIDIARCGIGDGTRKLEVWLSIHGVGSSVFRAYELVIEQSWHRADHITSFAIATPLVLNATPSPVETMMKQSIKDAVIAWNSVSSVGHSFGELQSSSDPDSADVIVKGYSTTAGNSNPCGDNNVNDSAVACVVNWRDDSQPPIYPHRSKDTLYFEHPPDDGFANTTHAWTRNRDRAGVRNSSGITYIYMPSAMMHELGHTAGLGHPDTTIDVMSDEIASNVKDLTDSDKKAMRSIYNNHAAH